MNIDELIDAYRGTCNTLLEEDEERLDQNKEESQQFYDEIFLCEDCSWWCEIHEQEDNGLCGGCNEE